MITDIKINKASLTDLNKILLLQKEAYLQEARIYKNYNIPPLTQDIDSLINDWKNGVVLKAEINKQIVGSVRGEIVNEICKIGKLMVKPGFQDQGLGSLLMKEIEMQFSHCSTFELFTGNKSLKNLAFYRKLGYVDYKEEKSTRILN